MTGGSRSRPALSQSGTAAARNGNGNTAGENAGSDRAPPQDLQAERSLLGAMLLSSDAVTAGMEGCAAGDFASPNHANIFHAIASLATRGEGVDPTTVSTELRRSGLLETIGGPAVLISLQSDTPATRNAGRYAASIVEQSRLRRLIALGHETVERGYGGVTDSAELAADLRSAVAEIEASLNGSQAAAQALQFLTAAELAAEVDSAPPVGFLARSVWPADAHGVIAAAAKAGKTWLIHDLVIAVSSGKPWLGVYEVQRAGRVLVFLGEGGKRKMLRRLRAVAEFHGVRFEDLPIDLCFRVPQLTSAAHLSIIQDKLAANPDTVLVVVDPLYLAAKGAKGSSLYDMATVLEPLQVLTQDAGVALAVIHHWNQTGKGSGAERMSGAGPMEWGRVLVSVDVKSKSTDPRTRATSATLDWHFEGDEIPDTDLRIRRRVWADRPDDLNSPMHYTVEELEQDTPAADGLGGETPAVRRVAAVLAAARVLGTALDVYEIGDRLADDGTGIPLKARTIQDALKRLQTLTLASSEPVPGSNALRWTGSETGSQPGSKPGPEEASY